MAEGAKSGAKGAVKSVPAAASSYEPIDVEPVMSGIFELAILSGFFPSQRSCAGCHVAGDTQG